MEFWMANSRRFHKSSRRGWWMHEFHIRRYFCANSNCVDTVDGPGRDPELRPFSNRSRSLMIFMTKNPNSSVSVARVCTCVDTPASISALPTKFQSTVHVLSDNEWNFPLSGLSLWSAELPTCEYVRAVLWTRFIDNCRVLKYRKLDGCG